MGGVDRVGQPRFVEFGVAEWLSAPPVVLLAAKVEDPA
jgi:hypothetical protein